MAEEIATPEVEEEQIETNEEVVEPLEETPKEEVAEEEQPEEAPEEEPVAETPEAPAEEPVSRRAALRIQQLLEQRKQQPQTPQTPQGLDYSQALDADQETIQQFEADRKAVSDQAYQQGVSTVETATWKNMLKFEARPVEEKYSFLNPRNKEDFNPAAADAMNQKYLRFVGYTPGNQATGQSERVANPDISYMDFVDAEMEFVDELASQKTASTQRNIAKQAAQTGLRPDGSQAKRLDLTKAPEDMTDEELKAMNKELFG